MKKSQIAERLGGKPSKAFVHNDFPTPTAAASMMADSPRVPRVYKS